MIEPKKIIIVRTDKVGDVILSTPVIRNLRLAFPKAHIAFMCQPYTKEILEENPDLNEIITYDKNNTHKSALASVLFALKLRKKQFDLAVILHPTNRVNIVLFLSGIPTRVGWNKKMGYLLTKKIPHTKQKGEKHETEYNLDVLRKIGVEIKDKSLNLPLNAQAEKKAQRILASNNIKEEEKFITLHLYASSPTRIWPEAYFLELINLIRDKTNFKTVVIGAENKQNNGISKITADADLRNKLCLQEMNWIIKKSSLVISTDSGPAHIAAALDVPVITIFGRKNPGLSPLRWKPLGKNSFYFHKDVGCVNCLAHNCRKGLLCFKAITPQEVFQKILEMIS